MGSVGKNYDKIDGETVSMSGNFNMLSEITQKLHCLSITNVINMDTELARDDEFRRGCGCMGKKI